METKHTNMILVIVAIVVAAGIVAYLILSGPSTSPTPAPNSGAPPNSGVPPNSGAPTNSGAPPNSGAPTPSSADSTVSGTSTTLLKRITGPLILSAQNGGPNDVHYDFCDLYNITQLHGGSDRKCYDMNWDQWLKKGTIEGTPLSETSTCWGESCSSSNYCSGKPFKGANGCNWCTLQYITLPEGVRGKAWQMNGNDWGNDKNACTPAGYHNPSSTILNVDGTTDITNNHNCALYFELAPGYTCAPTPS